MADRRGSRFVAEALFLVALAVALAFAHLDALEIAGGMLLGWLVVAALEWAAWRAEPHFGSGLPPRYYVPSLKLPPPKPLEQVDQGYPGAGGEEAPTWIASAALRAEVLGEWPLAAPLELEPEPDSQEPAQPEPVADPWTVAELSAGPIDEAASVAAEPYGYEGPGQLARHVLDPFAEAEPRRRFGRRSSAGVEAVEVAARPAGRRPLPGLSSRT
jgi:hypothetical protein